MPILFQFLNSPIYPKPTLHSSILQKAQTIFYHHHPLCHYSFFYHMHTRFLVAMSTCILAQHAFHAIISLSVETREILAEKWEQSSAHKKSIKELRQCVKTWVFLGKKLKRFFKTKFCKNQIRDFLLFLNSFFNSLLNKFF